MGHTTTYDECCWSRSKIAWKWDKVVAAIAAASRAHTCANFFEHEKYLCTRIPCRRRRLRRLSTTSGLLYCSVFCVKHLHLIVSVCECRARSTLVVAGGYTSISLSFLPSKDKCAPQKWNSFIPFAVTIRFWATVTAPMHACVRLHLSTVTVCVCHSQCSCPCDDVVCALSLVARISPTSSTEDGKMAEKKYNSLALCGRCELKESASESPLSPVVQIQCFQFHFVKCPKSIINLFGERRRRTLSRLHCALCAHRLINIFTLFFFFFRSHLRVSTVSIFCSVENSRKWKRKPLITKCLK